MSPGRVLLALSIVLGTAFSNRRQQSTDWPVYGGDPGGRRYSTLTQINRTNVSKLHVAWSYDAEEGRGDAQTQPIVVNGVLYGVTPLHRIIALDAATGKQLWKFDSGLRGRGPNRGLTWWTGGSQSRLFAAVQSYIYALDPSSGKPVEAFGRGGRIDLREDLGREPAKQSIILTSPGVIYENLLIVGGRTPESLPAPPGDIRAYDVLTGKLVWSFHTIPHPGEFGYDTWPADAWQRSGSANNWAGMAVDHKRGLVFVPTGSAASDFYGADRRGDNLFANSLLALDARTGKRVWHFQAVKHDIWDRDFPSQPTLVTVRKDGKRMDVIAQTSKQGWLYLFDRDRGQPIFPIQQHPYPESDTPDEHASQFQLRPAKPEPFSRQRLDEAILTTRTPQAHAWAAEHLQTLISNGQFVPFAVGKQTVIYPGLDGGAEWGGSAYDPDSGWLYVNGNDVPWTGSLSENKGGNSGRQVYLRNCGNCHGENRAGAPPQMPSLMNIQTKLTRAEMLTLVRKGAGRMPGFPALPQNDVDALLQYLISGEDKELQPDQSTARLPRYRFGGYHKFLDPDGFPAVVPPWGTLNAINLNTGDYAWRIPLGEYPELSAQGMPPTGTENYGGPIVTAGGLVFISATNFDRKFRAFDKQTGKLLWETTLPMSGNATPITYMVNGKQYLVIHATGGKARESEPSGGIYIAFSL